MKTYHMAWGKTVIVLTKEEVNLLGELLADALDHIDDVRLDRFGGDNVAEFGEALWRNIQGGM